jgi:hypothetical protein
MLRIENRESRTKNALALTVWSRKASVRSHLQNGMDETGTRSRPIKKAWNETHRKPLTHSRDGTISHHSDEPAGRRHLRRREQKSSRTKRPILQLWSHWLYRGRLGVLISTGSTAATFITGYMIRVPQITSILVMQSSNTCILRHQIRIGVWRR